MVENKKRKRDQRDGAASPQEKDVSTSTSRLVLPVRSKAAPVTAAPGPGAETIPSSGQSKKRDWQTFAASELSKGNNTAASLDRDNKRPRIGAGIAASETGENVTASATSDNKRKWQQFTAGETAVENGANAEGKRVRLSNDGLSADSNQVSSIPGVQAKSTTNHADMVSVSGLSVSDAGSPRVASQTRSVSGSDTSSNYGSDFSPSEIAQLDGRANTSNANGSTRYGSDWSEDTTAKIIEKVDELSAKRTAEWVNTQQKPSSIPRGIEERQRDSR